MTVDKVIAKIIWLTFFGPPCIASLFVVLIFHSVTCLRPHIYRNNRPVSAIGLVMSLYSVYMQHMQFANCRFEDDASFHYLKIPIRDHWSQSLTSYLPSAIDFIGMQSAVAPLYCPPTGSPHLMHS